MVVDQYDQIVGHADQINNLISAYGSERLASTLIFSGMSGIGKKKVAFRLVREILEQKNWINKQKASIREQRKITIPFIKDVLLTQI